MGDPKKQRKKFSKPSHPWQKERIELEKKLVAQYGLKRKQEIWKMNSILKNFLHRAKLIIGKKTSQSNLEREQMLGKIQSMGLLKKDSSIEDVLNLTLRDIMERRLQTILFRKNIAKTIVEARQRITHKHVMVGGKKITSPSYLVLAREESNIRMIGEKAAQ